MGRIAIPYGVKGWMKIQTFTEDADTLADYAEWYVKQANEWRIFQVANAKLHTNSLVAELVGISDRDQALALKGCEIAVPAESLPEPAENEYYWTDLVGLSVINLRGDAFGEVVQLLEAGAHDVLVVQGVREHLIPFVGKVVQQVDLATKLITVDWELDY